MPMPLYVHVCVPTPVCEHVCVHACVCLCACSCLCMCLCPHTCLCVCAVGSLQAPGAVSHAVQGAGVVLGLEPAGIQLKALGRSCCSQAQGARWPGGRLWRMALWVCCSGAWPSTRNCEAWPSWGVGAVLLTLRALANLSENRDVVSLSHSPCPV